MATLANLIVRINADAGNFYKEMKQAQKFTANMGKTFNLAGGALTRGVTLPLIGVAGSLGLVARSVANEGEQLYNLSQSTGVSVEKLSAFKLAADSSGASLEDFGKGMRGLASHMFAAQNGSKEAQRAFSDLGIGVVDNNRNLRDSEDVFLDVAEAFSKMEDGALKSALASEIFGKRIGTGLIPMMNLGRQGLIETTEETKKLGNAWSGEAAKAAHTFNNSVTKLWGAFDGLKIKIGTELFPVLTQLTSGLTSLISELGVIQLMIGGVNMLIKTFGALPMPIQGGILALGAMAIIAGPFLMFLGMMITNISVLIPLVFRLGLAFTALATGPLAIIGGLMALAVIGPVIYKNWEKVKDLFSTFGTIILALGKVIIGFVGEILVGTLLHGLAKIVEGLSWVIGIFNDDWARAVQNIADNIRGLANVFSDFRKNAVSELDAVVKSFLPVIEKSHKVTSLVAGFREKLIEPVGKLILGTINRLGDLVNVLEGMEGGPAREIINKTPIGLGGILERRELLPATGVNALQEQFGDLQLAPGLSLGQALPKTAGISGFERFRESTLLKLLEKKGPVEFQSKIAEDLFQIRLGMLAKATTPEEQAKQFLGVFSAAQFAETQQFAKLEQDIFTKNKLVTNTEETVDRLDDIKTILKETKDVLLDRKTENRIIGVTP